MLRGRLAVLVLLVLAGIALVTAVPARAHQAPGPQTVDMAAATSSAESGLAVSQLEVARSPGTALVAAPAQPQLPWPVVVAALGVSLLLRRRVRRVVVFTLVVLLAALAFENGLHSVHHGLDERRLGGCALGAASAHLLATPAADADLTAVILPVVAVAPERAQPEVRPRALRAQQGRAPPSATA